MTAPGKPTPPAPPPGKDPPTPGAPAAAGQLSPPVTRPGAAVAKGATPAAATPGKTPGGENLKGVALPRREGDRLQRLGRGGFGEVWKVRYLNSEEAWKYLPKKAGSDLAAFRETMNARGISHPNVVRVLDITEDEKNYIIRMDLVPGRDLDRVVSEDGVLEPEAACRYAAQIAGALEAAHRAGVLHLDLKPSNILLKEDGESVMISDFGISATLSRGLFQIEPSQAPGTPYFLAPEQLEARTNPEVELGPGVDIWAMGITLYYLLSLSYPFPFKDSDPTCILTERPRPLPELAPQVDDSLWQVLAQMLSRDSRSRYQNMAQVRAAFIDLSAKVTCPSCQRVLAVKEVHGSCPQAGCARPVEVAALLEQRALLGEGHRLLARCEHGAAIERYRKVLEARHAGSEDRKARAGALIAIAETDQRELAKVRSSIKDLRSTGDLLRALREIDRSRKRFSGDLGLREERQAVLAAIREICERAEPETKKLVKESRFADAKLLLMKIDSFLGYDPVRRELEEGPGAAGASAPPLKDLFGFVDERENFHATCQKELSKRIGALELKEAVACLQRLQRFFPCPENDQKIRQYTELQDSLELIHRGDFTKVCEALQAGKESLPAEPVEVTRLIGQCEHLLATFDPKKVPAMAEVARRRDEARKLAELITALGGRLRAQLETAIKSQRFDDQAQSIKKLLEIARVTDLLPSEETARYHEQLRKVQQVLDGADRKYQEGLRLVREHNYRQAIIALEAAEKMTPGRFGDIPGTLKKLNEQVVEEFDVYQQLSEIFNRLMGDKAVLEDFSSYFKLFQKTEAYRGAESIVELMQKLNQVIIRLFNLQNARLAQAAEEGERLTILVSTADTLLDMSVEMISGNFGQGSELDKRLLDFFGKIFGPLERGKVAGEELPGRLDHLRGVISEMVRLQGVVKPLRPQEYLPHPTERASAALLACRSAVLDGPEAGRQLAEIFSLHAELAELTDDLKLRRQLRKAEAVLKRAIRWTSLERSAHTLVKYVVWAAIPLVTAVVVAGSLYFYFHAREQRVQGLLVRDVLRPLQLGDQLPAQAAEASFLGRLLAGTEEEPRSAADGTAADLEWVGGKRSLHQRLEKLRISGAARTPEAEAWNKEIDRLEQERVLGPVSERIHGYLEKRLDAIIDRALVLKPAPAALKDFAGFAPLEKAREEVAAADRLAGLFAPPIDAARGLARQVDAAEEFVRTGKGLAAPPEGGLERKIHLLAHLGRLTTFYLQDLSWEALSVFRDPGRAVVFEELLHDRMGQLLQYRSLLAGDAELKKRLGELSAGGAAAPSAGTIGAQAVDPVAEVYRAVLEVLNGS